MRSRGTWHCAGACRLAHRGRHVGLRALAGDLRAAAPAVPRRRALCRCSPSPSTPAPAHTSSPASSRGRGADRGDRHRRRGDRGLTPAVRRHRARRAAGTRGRHPPARRREHGAVPRAWRGHGGDARAMGPRDALQRPRPLRGRGRDGGSAIRGPEPLGVASWARIELIEAAVRNGQTDLANEALAGFREQAAGGDWALGVEARGRALLSDGDAAEDATGRRSSACDAAGWRGCSRAPTRLRRMAAPTESTGDAREQLRTAYTMFTAMGPSPSPSVSARAAGHRREGPAPETETRDDLTAREGRSPASRGTASPTPRSAPACSSARERSSTTCTRSSASSASPRASSSRPLCRATSPSPARSTPDTPGTPGWGPRLGSHGCEPCRVTRQFEP